MNNKPYYHFNFGVDFRTDGFFNIHDKPIIDIDTIHYYKKNYAIFDIKPKRIEEPTMVAPFQAILPSLMLLLLE